MENRTNLYLFCLVLFFVAFAAFVIGFGTPVWSGNDTINFGLWQVCGNVFKDCTTYDFDQGEDFMIGVRAVEIFALVMFVLTFVDLIYENCVARFGVRSLSERLTSGILCILGGLGGLSGLIAFVVKTDLPSANDYGWSMYLVGSASVVAFFLGIGFIISATFIEKKKGSYIKSGANGHGPGYLTTNDENYELSGYTNRGMMDDAAPPNASMGGLNVSRGDNLPGFSMYNGIVNRPGGYRSMDLGNTAHVLPPFPGGRNGGQQLAPSQLKGQGYYSVSDDRALEPGFDLSEGFQPSRPQQRPSSGNYGDPYSRSGISASRRDDPYSRGGGDPYSRGGGGGGGDPYSRGGGGDPYSRGGRDFYSRGGDPLSRVGGEPFSRGGGEDPYSRGGGRDAGHEDPYSRYGRGPPRAGYNDPYGFDRNPQRGGDFGEPVSRDSFYRAGRF